MTNNRIIPHQRTLSITVTVDAPIFVSEQDLRDYILYELDPKRQCLSADNPCHNLNIDSLDLIMP